MGGKSGNGVPGSVLVFEHPLECVKEVVPHPYGDSCSGDGLLTKGVC